MLKSLDCVSFCFGVWVLFGKPCSGLFNEGMVLLNIGVFSYMFVDLAGTFVSVYQMSQFVFHFPSVCSAVLRVTKMRVPSMS